MNSKTHKQTSKSNEKIKKNSLAKDINRRVSPEHNRNSSLSKDAKQTFSRDKNNSLTKDIKRKGSPDKNKSIRKKEDQDDINDDKEIRKGDPAKTKKEKAGKSSTTRKPKSKPLPIQDYNSSQSIPISTSSLVRYDSPFLVSSTVSNKKLWEELDENNEKSEIFIKNIINNYNPETASDFSVKDALNKILPPRKIKTVDQMWVQYVSCNPVTKAEIINLQSDLNKKLVTEKARMEGICPIRERLYNECFDELIRQITINCLERGIILMRIKTESEMLMTTYQTLYDSNISYGIRKYLTAEEEKRKIKEEIYKIDDECEEWTKKIEEMEKNWNEKREKDKNENDEIIQDHKDFVRDYRWKILHWKNNIKEKLKPQK